MKWFFSKEKKEKENKKEDKIVVEVNLSGGYTYETKDDHPVYIPHRNNNMNYEGLYFYHIMINFKGKLSCEIDNLEIKKHVSYEIPLVSGKNPEDLSWNLSQLTKIKESEIIIENMKNKVTYDLQKHLIESNNERIRNLIQSKQPQMLEININIERDKIKA